MVPDKSIARAALVYALREGWTRSERDDLHDAEVVVREILDAYNGDVDGALVEAYCDEFDAINAASSRNQPPMEDR